MVGGGRVRKDSLLMQAIGDVDELNAVLGLCRAEIARGAAGGLEPIDEILHKLQQEIFNLGADLATPLDSLVKVPRVTVKQVAQLEKWIDEIDAQLSPLQNFILPGGTILAANLHMARAVCRRAERAIVALAGERAGGEGRSASEGAGGRADAGAAISENIVKYVNRLSDLLFVMARWGNMLEGVAEEVWKA